MATVKRIPNSDPTRWRVRWTDPNDRDRERRFPTAAAARAFAATVESDKARGTYADPARGRTSFRTVAEEWLASLGDTSERTRNEYQRLLTARILPVFGARPIANIRRTDADHFWQTLRTQGLRPQTIRRIWHPFQATLGYAVVEEYIPRSPARGVKLPRDRHTDRFKGRRLTFPQVEALAAATPPTASLIIRLLGTSGLRPAELAGPNIEDITLSPANTAALIRVERTRTLVKALGWVEADPKTTTSIRAVPLRIPSVVADLDAYLDTHPRADDPDAPLFYGRAPTGDHAPDPHRFWDLDTFRRRTFDPAARAAGLTPPPLRLYDLRGTAATLWASAGLDIFQVSRRLGHASVVVTEKHYADLWSGEAAGDREAQALAALFSEQQEADDAQQRSNVIPLRREPA